MSVRCKLCSELFKIISTTHLKNVHGINLDKYKKKFPDAKLVSKNLRAKISSGVSRRWEEDTKYNRRQLESTRSSTMVGNKNARK